MPVPEIRMTFDTENFTTFIKELLNLEQRIELKHSRFDSTILFKCNGDMDRVRDTITQWLKDREKVQSIISTAEASEQSESTGSAKEPEKDIRERIKETLSDKVKEAK